MLDPLLDAFPASHARQVSDEVADGVELYRPASQLVQEPEASVVEYVPDWQATQVLSDVAPIVELAFPASHARQEVADGVEL